MCSRRTLVAAKSQQRPEDFWLVDFMVLMSVENLKTIFRASSGRQMTLLMSVVYRTRVMA